MSLSKSEAAVHRWSSLGIDAFRLITSNLSILEFVRLSSTCKTLRILCMRDLNVGSNDSTIQDFGMKLLDLATCPECNLTSWKMYYGRCKCRDELTCTDCLRHDRKELFVFNQRSDNDKNGLVPVCRYGCNFICNICERQFANGIHVRTIEDWVICKYCQIKHFHESYERVSGFIMTEYIFHSIAKWKTPSGHWIDLGSVDKSVRNLISDPFQDSIELCAVCGEDWMFDSIFVTKHNRTNSGCKLCINLNDPDHSTWKRRAFSTDISLTLMSKIRKFRILLGLPGLGFKTNKI